MKRLLAMLLTTVLVLSAAGCGGDPPKGANRGKDKPVPAEKKDAE